MDILSKLTTLDISNISCDQIIKIFDPAIKILSAKYYTKYSRMLEFDDIFQMGRIGLLDAYDRYEPKDDCSFATYAFIRIHGNIVDEIRKYNFIPRNTVKKFSIVSKIIAEFENIHNRIPKFEEVELSDISKMEFLDILGQYKDSRKFINIDNLETEYAIFLGFERGADEKILEMETNRVLDDAINSLSGVDKIVFNGYYKDDKKLYQIGEELGLTESRVCQIVKNIQKKLKHRVNKDLDIF